MSCRRHIVRDEGCDGGDDDSDDAKLNVRSINDIQTTVYVYRDSIYNSRVGPKAWKVGYMKGWLITTISSFWIPDGNYTGDSQAPGGIQAKRRTRGSVTATPSGALFMPSRWSRRGDTICPWRMIGPLAHSPCTWLASATSSSYHVRPRGGDEGRPCGQRVFA